MSELETTPLYRVLSRPPLLLGGERELVIPTGILCLIIIYKWFCLPATGIALSVWFFAIWIYRKMAKADPLAFKIYVRHNMRFRRYYPARSSIWCKKSFKG
jgi:type IV secretory pathway TrbD component